ESVHNIVRVSPERAKLITDFYSSDEIKGKPIALQRAFAFRHLLEHCAVPIESGQLIVGIRGTGPGEVPTYPEICLHTPQDLEILNSRENMPYAVDEKTLALYREMVIPCWKGKAMRDMLFALLPAEWKAAYEAGIFTEFMEQRTPGHTAGGERIFRMGLLDLIDEIRAKISELHPSSLHYDELQELEAMLVVSEAMITYANRYAKALQKLAEEEDDPSRKRELE